MAAGTKLVLEFYDSDDKTVQFSFNYAKPSAGLANVKALMNAMITNTAIFAKTLVAMKSAKEVTTSENEYDVTDSASVYLANSDVDPEAEVTRVTSIPPLRKNVG